MDPVAVAGLLPEGAIVLSAANTEDALALVTEGEAALVARAIDKRKREFATGRALAREALRRLGAPAVEIPSAPDRAPIWPAGVAGSISHCDTRAVVAARRFEEGTVGIDVEHRAVLKAELWPSVFLPSELERLAGFEGDRRGRIALAVFSAKEALYKAQYPWTSTYMGFRELEVELVEETETTGVVRCTFQNDVGRFARGSVQLGRYDLAALAGGELVTAVAIPR